MSEMMKRERNDQGGWTDQRVIPAVHALLRAAAVELHNLGAHYNDQAKVVVCQTRDQITPPIDPTIRDPRQGELYIREVLPNGPVVNHIRAIEAVLKQGAIASESRFIP